MDKIEGKMETMAVFLNGKQLNPQKSQEVWNHSPDGFCWGYSGSGPAQLALAILLEFTSEDNAVKLHQSFKSEVISALPADFHMEIDMRDWIRKSLQIPRSEKKTKSALIECNAEITRLGSASIGCMGSETPFVEFLLPSGKKILWWSDCAAQYQTLKIGDVVSLRAFKRGSTGRLFRVQITPNG